MRLRKRLACGVGLILMWATVAMAGDFDFLRELDRKAREDHKAFSEHMSIVFGVPVPRIDKIIREVGSPADAFMVLKIGKLSGRSYDDVFHEYRSNKKQGWGVMAKNMGIKPGSAEFHELKKGGSDVYGGASSKGKDKGKGKDKKGKGRGK